MKKFKLKPGRQKGSKETLQHQRNERRRRSRERAANARVRERRAA
jgi:hypothetical protein